MPQSLDIAVFVFGAILILLSLVVGSFKLFGAEVQGTVGRLGRVVAFLLGLILITSRLGQEKPAMPATGPSAAGVVQASVAGPTERRPDQTADLAGIAPRARPTGAGDLPAVPDPAEGDPPPGRPAPRPGGGGSFNEFVVGQWTAVGNLTSGDLFVSVVQFERDGTFFGTNTVNGAITDPLTPGTWSVRSLAKDRFALTTRTRGKPATTSTVHVLDHDSVENEQLHVVYHRNHE